MAYTKKLLRWTCQDSTPRSFPARRRRPGPLGTERIEKKIAPLE
jgi:hypothetical protein